MGRPRSAAEVLPEAVDDEPAPLPADEATARTGFPLRETIAPRAPIWSRATTAGTGQAGPDGRLMGRSAQPRGGGACWTTEMPGAAGRAG